MNLRNKFICSGIVLFSSLGQASAAMKVFSDQGMALLNSRNWDQVSNYNFDKEQYSLLRGLLKEYGIEKFYQNMVQDGVISQEGNILPTNPFAQILEFGHIKFGDKVITPPYSLTELEEKGFHEEQSKYLLAGNKKILDDSWNMSMEDWKATKNPGLPSMSQWHKFLVPRDTHWNTFNILTFGFDVNAGSVTKEALEKDIALLKDMKNTALKYAKAVGIGKDNVYLFFHVFPVNTVNTLHMHLINLIHLGPSYDVQSYKNLTLEDALEVLNEELQQL